MKKTFILVVAFLLVAAVAFGANSVVGSKHDMRTKSGYTGSSTEVCVFCHTPHQATAALQQDPLWNHSFTSTASFGVYSSLTLNADMSAAEIGGGTAPGLSVSLLCMSCHDGTVAVNALFNPPNAGTVTFTAGSEFVTGNANIGTDLRDDHPVNFAYNSSVTRGDTGLNAEASLPAGLLIGGMVQCSSCHNVHDNTYLPFLRVDNTNSGLCTTCHNK